MNKSSITHVIVMIVAISVGSWLAPALLKDQTTSATSQAEITKTSLCGFNKFTADIQWMFFVNYCGRVALVKQDNSDVIYNKLNDILNNDSAFLKAYLVGGMMISSSAPMKAFDVFYRGVNNKQLKNNARLPFLAGYVLVKGVNDKEWSEYLKTHKDLPDRLGMAEQLFKTALERDSSAPAGVVSLLLHSRAERIQQRGRYKGIKVVNEYQAYLFSLLDYWQKNKGKDIEGDFYDGGISIDEIKKRMLDAIRYAKSEYPNDKYVSKTINMVVNKVLQDQHICPSCFHAYAPGDKYCSACGGKVPVYGICEKCGKVLKGDFCSSCGAKSK